MSCIHGVIQHNKGTNKSDSTKYTNKTVQRQCIWIYPTCTKKEFEARGKWCGYLINYKKISGFYLKHAVFL